jgi:hypothetical protein
VFDYNRKGSRAGQWFSLLAAAHHASGGHPNACELFVEWSIRDPDYRNDAEAIRTRWMSLDPEFEGGFTVGTLIQHVREAGGSPRLPAHLVFEPVDASGSGGFADADERGKKARIVVSKRHHDEILDDIVEAVVARNDPPALFQQGPVATSISQDSDDRPILRFLTARRFQDLAIEAAYFFTIGQGGKLAPARLSMQDAGAALERLVRRNQLPELRGIIDHPIVRNDGSVLCSSGYDAETRLYSVEDLVLDAPERPSPDEIQESVVLLDEVFGDFPFKDDGASRANTLAIPITLLMREAIGGLVPMFGVTATTPSSGKTKLVESAIGLVTGRVPSRMAPLPVHNPDEVRKKITTILLSGREICFMDNAKERIESGELEALLTGPGWQDRRLGGNDAVELPNRTSWFVTGNNLRLGHEIFRRTVVISLDPQMAHPERRDDRRFRHRMPDWAVGEGRLSSLRAALTLCRAWFAAGQPGPDEGVPPVGNFERWRWVVGGVLRIAGVEGFLANVGASEGSDPLLEQWAAFLSLWHREIGSRAVPLREVFAKLQFSEEFKDVLPEDLPEPESKGFRRELGKKLAGHKGRRFALASGGDVWVSQANEGARGGVNKWCVHRG